MAGLSFEEFRSRAAGQMRGGAGAAGNVPTGAIHSAIRGGAADIGKLGVGKVQAHGYAKRGIERANNQAKITKDRTEHTVDLNKRKNKFQADQIRDKAGSNTIKTLIGTGAKLIGASLMYSDETTKNTIENIEDALSTLRGLNPVTYYYNEEYSSNPERLHHGFIAQDYQQVMPDATYLDESTGKLCIDTSELIALLVRGIQQLETRVARMEAANALAGVK